MVGKAKIAKPPGAYRVVVTLRNSPTLAPQPDREPYSPAPPLRFPPVMSAFCFYWSRAESVRFDPHRFPISFNLLVMVDDTERLIKQFSLLL